jgi:hypothetical protein
MLAVVATTLTVAAGAHALAPNYQFALYSRHEGAVPFGFTYRGDTLVAAFRNKYGNPGERRPYRVCRTRTRGWRCLSRTLVSYRWSEVRVRVLPGYVRLGRRSYIEFRWYVGGVRRARMRMKVYE